MRDLKSDTYGFFYLYFYTNIFSPRPKSQTLNEQKLTGATIEKLLNEIFTLNTNENEKTIEEFAHETELSRG